MSDRYRVRDKNTSKGPGTVWGENLTYAEATHLKEVLCGSNKSMTARVEPMDSLPAAVLADPVLVAAKARAAAAASSGAAEAQRRANAYQAKQKADAIVASLPKVEEFDDGDLDDGSLDAPGDVLLDELLDGVDTSPPKPAT
jgi:hypothetical protein